MSSADLPAVLVVGAGLIGRATAYYLARAGARVQIVDADPDPSLTSRASLGVLSHVNGRDDALGSFYRDAHALQADLAGQLRRETGLEVGWWAPGGLDLIATEEEEAEARQTFEFNRERGCPVEWVQGDQLRELEPGVGDGFGGALYFPGDHRVDPEALGAALLAAARQLGAEVELGAEVTALEPGPAGTVTAQVRRRVGDAAPMGADRVVLAAGAWSERLMMGAGPDEAAVRPIRGQQARFRGAAVPRHILRHGGFHAVPLAPPDGSTAEPPGSRTVLVGATVEEVGFEAEVTAAAGADFAAALDSMLGPGQVLVEQRAGLRPKPRKGRPVIGPLPGCEQVIAATGHYKSGVLMAPLTGQVVAQWALTGSPDRDMTHFAVHR